MNTQHHTETQTNSQSLSSKINLKNYVSSRWFPAALFLVLATLYFLPYLNFSSIIAGTDDGPRGWYSQNGDLGHAFTSPLDKWVPLDGGSAMMERRFGRFINPTYPLYLIMPKYQARIFEYIFWIFCAGLFMFLYVRSLGISRSVAYVCGIGFMFAPGLVSNIFPGHFAKMEVIACFPGLMFFVERIFKKPSIWDILGIVPLIALSIYSQHLQMAYFVLVGMGLYFAARMTIEIITKKRLVSSAIRSTLFFVAALTLGATTTAMNTFPSMKNTTETSKRAGGVDYDYASSYALHAEEVASFIEPDFVGWKEYYWGQNGLKLNSEYFGILFLFLAILLFVAQKPNHNQVLFGIAFLVALFYALGPNTPFHRLAYELLPGIKSFRAPSMMYIWCYFSAFALAAYSLEAIRKNVAENNALYFKKFLWASGISVGGAFLFMIATGPLAQWWYSSIYTLAAREDQKFRILQAYLPTMQTGAVFTFIVITGFCIAAHMVMKKKISMPVFIGLTLACILIDALRISYPFLSQAAKPKTAFLRQEAGEHSIGQFFTQIDTSLYRVHSMIPDGRLNISGIDFTFIFDDFPDKNYNDLIQVLQSASYAIGQPQYQNIPQLMNRYSNLLNIINAKYILALQEVTTPSCSLILNSNGLRIYKNTTVFPRFYFASEYIGAQDQIASLTAMLDQSIIPQNTIIVNNRDLPLLPKQNSIDSTLQNAIVITKYEIRKGHIALHVTSNKEQVLVITENYNPGWTATVNGKKAQVYRVNVACKGIAIPQGISTVILTYNSPSAVKWRKVTTVALGVYVLVLLGAVGWQMRRKKSK